MKSNPLTIYGRIPVLEVLRLRPDLVKHIYVMGSIQQSKASDIKHLARGKRIPIDLVSKKIIEGKIAHRTTGEDINHQGIIAELAEFPYHDMKEFVATLDLDTKPAIMILDEIQDTHNVGAIIRSAAAAGFTAVCIPEHRQAPINSTVFKTSAGMIMKIPIIRIGNVNQALEYLKEKGFWSYALVQDGQTSLYDYVNEVPSVFIVGNEGSGVRPHTQELSDYTLSIPMAEGVESLNASVSAALVMYEWSRKN